MSLQKEKIGIIGVGYVGGVLKFWFEKQKYQLFLYDKYKKIGSVQEVNKADIVFICVPTPYLKNKGYDDSAVRESLGNLKAGKIVVIKSTILPGSTERYQEEFFKLKILFNPEFLTERNALKDFFNPDRQIVGYTKKSKKFARKILNILPPAPHQKIIPASEAEMVKFMANSFLALKVVFANEFYNLCRRLNIDYEKVKEGVGEDKRIGPSHLDIFRDNYRGYGGSCLPKDIKTILDFARTKKSKLELLEKARLINKKLLKESGLTEECFLRNNYFPS